MFWMYCTMGEITRNLVTYIKEKFKRDSSCHLEIFWHPSLLLTGYAWITNCFSYSIQQIIRHRGPVKTKDQGHISWKPWSPDIKDHHPSFYPPTGLSTIIFTMTKNVPTSQITNLQESESHSPLLLWDWTKSHPLCTPRAFYPPRLLPGSMPCLFYPYPPKNVCLFSPKLHLFEPSLIPL